MTSDLPKLVRVLGGLALGLLALPTLALLWQTPWSDSLELALSQQSISALRVSMVVSLSATALAACLGIPLAASLASTTFRFGSPLRVLVVLPLVLPPVATGVGLLAAFGRQGVSGRLLGFGLANTTAGAILASTVVAMPFLVLTIEGGLRHADADFRQIAATLGANPRQRLSRVTLPLARRSIVAGTVLAWARAVGEFGATITFAGNVEGVTRTLPLQIALALEQDRNQALMLSVVMVLLSLLVMAVLRNYLLSPVATRSDSTGSHPQP